MQDFDRFRIQKSTFLSVLHLNLRYVLGNNFDELCLKLNEIKANFSVIVHSETFLFTNKNYSILEGNTSYAGCRNCN